MGAKRLVTAQCRGDPKPLFVIDRLINEHTIVVTSESVESELNCQVTAQLEISVCS